MSPKEKEFGIDLEDEVVRGSIVTQEGKLLPPAPRPAPPPPPAAPVTNAAKEADIVALTPFQKTSREVGFVTAGMTTALALGKATGPAFMDNVFTFGLASLIGYRIVWGVTPALHSPLMSVTNAISGMVGIGGLFVLGGGILPETIPQAFGAASVLLAFVNVSGGFVLTKRMLDMFKRPTDPPEYPWMYAIPAVMFGGGYLAAASTGAAGLIQAGYMVSSILCISSISSLASQATARMGNVLGILGVGSGVLSSLLAVGFSPEVLTQFGILATVGSLLGKCSQLQPYRQYAKILRFRDRQAHHTHRPSSDRGSSSFRRRLGRCLDLHRQCDGRARPYFDFASGHSLSRCLDW